MRFVQPAVRMRGRHGAQQARRMHAFQAHRLHVVVQLRGGVEIGDEVLDLEPLRSDDPRACARLFGCALVLHERVGVAENHRQRRADVVGDAANPACARGVLLLDDGARLGDLVADVAQIPFEVQLGRAPVRQRVERFGDGSHGVLRPATRHRVDGVQDPEVDCEYQQHVQREVAHGRRGVGERHRPELVLRETHDQQAVVPIPEKRRIVGDGRIMRCHRHVVHAEPVGHVLRLVLRPGHRAVRPDDERPGVLLAERLQAALPKRP